MKKPVAALLLSLLAAGALAADKATEKTTKWPEAKVRMETCLEAALAAHPGDVLKLELRVEDKQPVYEFEIAGSDKKFWDVECSGASGKVTETEQRVKSADDPLFKAKAKVNEADAKKAALEKFPGEVAHTEYEIESDGNASYEFDIKQKDGSMRVEVDAATGKIVESSHEYMQIGRIPK
ncbi:MAG TPA: PepSY domain-containing protein [Rhodocyclaceae bacterium]